MTPPPSLPGPLRRLPLVRPRGASSARPPLPGAPRRVLLELDLSRGLAEEPPTNPIEALRAMHTPLLRTLVDHLHRATTDPQVVGLVANLGASPVLTLSQSGELRAAVAAFRAAGRPTLAWAPSFGEFGIGTTAYHVAAAFEQVWLQPSGGLGLIGFSAQAIHLRGTLDRLDIEPQIHQRHEYKSAADTFTRTEMSEPVREMLARLVASATDTVVVEVARDRSLSEQLVRDLMDDAPLSAVRARDAGLVDWLGYRDEAYDAIRARINAARPGGRTANGEGSGGGEETLRYVERHGERRLDAVLDRVRSMAPGRVGPPRHGRPMIAVVQASGPILAGRRSAPLAGGGAITADRLGAVLRAAGRHERVRAVVLRIDSPGGSYVASDAIRQDVLRLRRSGTPVIASMASVAASGGYFIAMGCDPVLAGAGTVTGSIGVLAGKQVVRRTLERVGITQQTVPGSRHADMFSSAVPFDEDELARLDSWLDAVYDDFTSKAAADRGMDLDALRSVARGRVWSGADAVDHGLVDAIGHLSDAVDAACGAVGLARRDVDVRAFPVPNPLQALLPAKNSDDVGMGGVGIGGGGMSAGRGPAAGLLLGAEGPPLWTTLLTLFTGSPLAAGLVADLSVAAGPLTGLGVLSLPPMWLAGLLPGH